METILGWGAKTIARYETTQIQDVAYDNVLREININKRWFLQLLEKTNLPNKGKIRAYVNDNIISDI